MTDTPQPETPVSPENRADDLSSEFRELGKNIVNALRTAWESDERKKLHEEIFVGLNELGTTLSRAGSDFAQSSAGQTLKTDFEDFQQRVQTGEVETKIRSELLAVLRAANTEIKKAVSKSPSGPAEPKE